MATAKFTLKRGRTRPEDVILTAGAAEAQSDTISVNVDLTLIKKGEVVQMLEAIQNAILRGKWPVQ